MSVHMQLRPKKYKISKHGLQYMHSSPLHYTHKQNYSMHMHFNTKKSILTELKSSEVQAKLNTPFSVG